jgi:tetraacyldisaccharide 4'-kinase
MMPFKAALEFLYYNAFLSKKLIYSSGILSRQKVDVPVISIGNISVGGTGKTPAVISAARVLKRYFKNPGILSRGYKSRYAWSLNLYCDGKRTLLGPDWSGDEPMILQKKLGLFCGVSCKDRARGAEYLVKKLGVDVILLDDAYQYWKFERDLNILLIDKTDPFGKNRLLPVGRLREPVSSIARADMVIVTRANHEGPYTLKSIFSVIKKYNPNAVCAVSNNLSGSFYQPGPSEFIKSSLENKKIVPFCGIGNPGAFFNDLIKNRALIENKFVFPDHYEYKKKDIENIIKKAGPHTIVTTLKDWVKIEHLKMNFSGVSIGYYDLEADFPVSDFIRALISARIIPGHGGLRNGIN